MMKKGLSKEYRIYARSYKIKIIDEKDPLSLLEANKSSTKELFKDLLDEIWNVLNLKQQWKFY